MSVARKTILIITTFVVGVPTVAFLAAKITSKRKSASASVNIAASSKNETEKPLFYDSIGSSDPDSAVTKGTQRVIRYTVNVKTVRTREEAEHILANLSAAGLSGYYTPVRQKEHVLYHVRLGIYPDEREATNTLATLQKKTKISGSVTKLQ